MKYNGKLKYNSNLTPEQVKYYCRYPQKLVGTNWQRYNSVRAIVAVTGNEVTTVLPDLRRRVVLVEELLGSHSEYCLVTDPLPRLGGLYTREDIRFRAVPDVPEQQYFVVKYISATGVRGLLADPSRRTGVIVARARSLSCQTPRFTEDGWRPLPETTPEEEARASAITVALNSLSAWIESGRQHRPPPAAIRKWDAAFPDHRWPEEVDTIADDDEWEEEAPEAPEPTPTPAIEIPAVPEEPSMTRAQHLKFDPFSP